MTQQTLKKRLYLKFRDTLQESGIVLADELAKAMSQIAVDESTARKNSKRAPCSRDMQMALCAACKYIPASLTKATWNNISSAGTTLESLGVCAADIPPFVEWWGQEAWREKVTLTPKLIQDNWGRFLADVGADNKGYTL